MWEEKVGICAWNSCRRPQAHHCPWDLGAGCWLAPSGPAKLSWCSGFLKSPAHEWLRARSSSLSWTGVWRSGTGWVVSMPPQPAARPLELMTVECHGLGDHGSVAPASLWGEEGRPEAQKRSCGGLGLVAQGRKRHPRGEEVRGSDKPIPENRCELVPEGGGPLALAYLVCLRKGPSGEGASALAHEGICQHWRARHPTDPGLGALVACLPPRLWVHSVLWFRNFWNF